MRRLARILAVLAAASGALRASPARGAPVGSPWGERYFPNVELVTQEGEKVHFYEDLLRDKHVVVSFVFTHCAKQCPLMTANLARVQRELGDRVGKDIFFYSITMDPERDTPEVLARYARSYKAGPGWTFLTGKPADVELLRRKFGDLAPIADHAATINIGNDRVGQWWHTGAVDNPKYLATLIGDWMDPEFRGKPGARSYAEATRVEPPTRGQVLFRDNCVMCHLPGGRSVGPDLADVTRRRPRAWLARWIRSPGKLVSEKDPVALELLARHDDVLMPELDLKEADVDELLRFLESRRPGGTAGAAKPSAR